ncbi:glycosyltransferase [Stenotrophomonas maltophilia]
MAKVVFLMTRPFLPVVGGRERMLRQHLEYLVDRFDDVMVICFKGRGETIDVERYRRQFPSVAFHFTPYPAVVDVLRGAFQLGLAAPLQCLAFFGKRKSRWITSQIADFGPDVVVVDMLRLWSYVRHWDSTPLVLDIDDLLSVRYQRQLSSGATDVLGTFRERLPSVAGWLANVFAARLLAVESKRLAKMELDVTASAASVIFVSELEAERHRLRSGAANLHSVPPMSADVVCVRPPRSHQGGMPLRLAFLGNLKAPQNLQALRYVVGTLLPILLDAGVEYSLDVIGSIDARVAEELSRPGITFHGFVDDLNEALRETDLHLAPILSGTGVKTKIVDAFAIGVPTVTTSLGLEGLAVEGRHVALVFDTPEHFLEIVRAVITDPAMLHNISSSASAYVSEQHAREVVFARYSKAYERLGP